jgi:hypothetical protein
MSAWVLAALCSLLSFGFSRGGPEPVASPVHRLVVYLLNGLSPEVDRTVSYMRRELETLLSTAGYKVEWKVLGNPSGADQSVLAVVELRGSCRAPAANTSVKPVENGASLASTAVEGDKVLPFTWINCETLTQLLAPRLAKAEPGRRDFLYGRAMGRVLAHELYHLLANKREHTGSGVGKASFSASDILGEHFSFEGSTLPRVRPGVSPQDSSASAEPASTAEPDSTGR